MANPLYIYQDLKTNSENCSLNEKILQGATNRQFAFTLFDRAKQSLIGVDAKISVIVLYDPLMVNGILTYKGVYKLDPTDPTYNITTRTANVDNDFTIIDVPFREEFVTYAGNCSFIVEIVEDDSTVFTYSMSYFVDKNDGYFPTSIPNNLPSFQSLSKELQGMKISKADVTLANVPNDIFKAKVRATGIGTIESGAEIKAELEKLPVGERLNYEKLDNKPEMPLNAADVDLSNVSTEIFSEKVKSTKAYNDLLEIINKGNELIFTENGQEVHNKILHYNLTTGQLEVVDKVV